MADPSSIQPDLLDASARQLLAGLSIGPGRPVGGVYAGRHRSRQLGQSAEFHDHRPYAPGDEPRRVDWKLAGRTDRLYVRRYRHDAELPVHLLIDRSASMGFASIDRPADLPSKWRYALQLAAGIGFIVANQGDRLSLSRMGEHLEPIDTSAGPSETLQRAMGRLVDVEPVGRVDPMRCLAQVGAGAGQGVGAGLAVIISDLLEPAGTWLGAIGQLLNQRWQVILMQVLSPQELDLRQVRAGQLIDPETGGRVSVAPDQARRRYVRRMRDHLEALGQGAGAHGIDYRLYRTDQSPFVALREHLASGAAGAKAGSG